MVETYTIACGLAAAGALLATLSFLVARDWGTGIQMVGGLLLLAFYMTIWFLGRRFKSRAVQLIALQYLILQGFTAIYWDVSEAPIEGLFARIAT